MVSEQSKANLAKGRVKGIKRSKPNEPAKTDANNTFASIFHFIEGCPITESEWEILEKVGITKERVKAAGITNERKLKKCLNIFLDDAPGTIKEYLQRSEPQDIGIKVKGEINVFQYETIDRLLASRSSGDPSEPSAS